MKEFTKFEKARLRRTAQNVDQFISKKNKLVEKRAQIDAELAEINNLIELTDAPTRAMTGGYGTEDIIRKVVTPTDKLNKDGSIVKQTSFEFLYPDTIIPPVEETVDTAAETVDVEGTTDSADFNSGVEE